MSLSSGREARWRELFPRRNWFTGAVATKGAFTPARASAYRYRDDRRQCRANAEILVELHKKWLGSTGQGTLTLVQSRGRLS